MEHTKNKEVKIYGGRIGIINRVFYEMVNGEETDNIYCYEMTIDGVSGYVVYPDEIEE